MGKVFFLWLYYQLLLTNPLQGRLCNSSAFLRSQHFVLVQNPLKCGLRDVIHSSHILFISAKLLKFRYWQELIPVLHIDSSRTQYVGLGQPFPKHLKRKHKYFGILCPTTKIFPLLASFFHFRQLHSNQRNDYY